MCINRGNTGIPVYEESGTIGNGSTTKEDWLHVGCPILRDDVSGVNMSSAKVRMIDRSRDYYIECRIIYASPPLPNTPPDVDIKWSFARRSSGVDVADEVEWGGGSLPLPPTSRTHYLLSCIIPPIAPDGAMSQIVSYEVIEVNE